MIANKFSKLKWWQLALLSVAASAIGGLANMQSHKRERKTYKDLKQATWAPPAAAFGPAWTINNFFLLLALKRLLNSDIPERKKLLLQQAMIWLIFFSFGYVYFNKKSPVLGAIWTVGDAALAIASFSTAFKTDKKLSYNYLPLLGWTVFASTIAGYQALKNPDPITHTPALL